MSREDVELVRSSWTLWESGDFDAALAKWADDVVWDATHFEGWMERDLVRGIDDVRAFLVSDWLGSWDRYEAGLKEAIDAGDRVFVICWQRMTGRGSGAPVETETAQLYTVRDGKVTRIENYTDIDEARRAAGLGE